MNKKGILLLMSMLSFVFGNIFSQADSTEIRWGCMDPAAINYDSLATDWSPNYPCYYDSAEVRWGCMDPAAINYDSLATDWSPNYPCYYDTTNVSIDPPAVFPQMFCEGATIADLQAQALPGYAISWYSSAMGGNVLPNNTQLVSGVYYVSQRDSISESERAAVDVTVVAMPVVNINANISELTCVTPSINLIAVGGNTYSWNNGLGNGAVVTVTAPGTYTVTATDAYGCADSASIIITSNVSEPTAVITPNPATFVLTNTTPRIILTATGGGTYAWDNGLGNSANVTITTPGVYIVTVTAPNGCYSIASIAITENKTPIVYGCMDSTATNYNPQANAWSPNYRCVYDVQAIYGCTDRFAENYSPNANTNDGSCTYKKVEDLIEGCMDTLALNYNPVATIPGNGCVFEITGQPVYGCTDLKALNYNPNATELDNSCVYSGEGNTYNGIITEEPDDVVGTKPVKDCDLDAGLSIISAFISSVSFISEHQITVHWVIVQEDGNTAEYTVVYTISGPGNIMFYLSIVCNKLSLTRSSDADVTGYTVSAAYDVLRSTSINICQPEAAANNLTVYPNPFTDWLTILVKGAKTVHIALYSVAGTQLASYSNLNEVQIATSKLPAGVYVVKVIADGKTETATVVKK